GLGVADQAADARDAQRRRVAAVAARALQQPGLPHPLAQLVRRAVLVAAERQLGQRALGAAGGVDRAGVAVELARAGGLAERPRELVAAQGADHVDRVALAPVARPVGRAGDVEHAVDLD